jgi:hypothetical protein
MHNKEIVCLCESWCSDGGEVHTKVSDKLAVFQERWYLPMTTHGATTHNNKVVCLSACFISEINDRISVKFDTVSSSPIHI